MTEVMPGSPAAEAGIQKDDFVISINGSDLGGIDYQDLRLLRGQIGSSASIVVNRKGQTLTFTVVRVAPNGAP